MAHADFCRPLLCPLVLVVGVAGTAAHADALGDAIASGKASLELRYRFENVEQDPFAKEANASTLRTRLRYVTGDWHSTMALIEIDNVSLLGDERFNDTRNGETTFPVVVDPHGANLNQALIKYSGMEKTVVTVGRQRLNLDNQRFIGSVGWRQNEQTLDGAVIEYKGIEHLTATYGFVSRVNRIFGPVTGSGATVAEFDGETHLLNLKYAVNDKLSAVLYDYLLDFDNAAPGLSSQTIGLRLAGKVPVGGLGLGYTAEYAQQSDYKDNTASFAAPYLLAELNLGGKSADIAWDVMAGYELLGEDQGVAVQTPLATGHKFQGWADKFLGTPAVGLIDTYVGGKAVINGVAFLLVVHQYEGDAGGADYGDEINAEVSKTFAKRYTVAAKYADYRTGDVPAVTDTSKFWLTMEAKF